MLCMYIVQNVLLKSRKRYFVTANQIFFKMNYLYNTIIVINLLVFTSIKFKNVILKSVAKIFMNLRMLFGFSNAQQFNIVFINHVIN